MSTNKTTNLGLHSWVRSDRFSMDEFNENFNAIDKAVGENKAGLAAETQARQSAVSAETQARQSAVSAETAARQALAQTVAKCGNCRILYRAYTGDGKNPTTFTFDRKPLFICIFGDNLYFFAVQGAPYGTCRSGGAASAIAKMTWTGNSVTWTAQGEAQFQFNSNNLTYHMVVLMEE